MHAVFVDFATVSTGDLDPHRLERALPGIRFWPDTQYAQLARRVATAEVVLVNKARLDAAVLGAAPRLRLICLAASGTDNVDLEAARARHRSVQHSRLLHDRGRAARLCVDAGADAATR